MLEIKIEEKNKDIAFEDIDVGQVFMDQDSVFIKIKSEDSVSPFNKKWNAVNLNSSKLSEFKEDYKIKPVDGKLILSV